MARYFAMLALLGAACWLHAQTPKPSAAAPPPYPVVTLSFGSPQPTPLGKKGSVMLDNATCAPDGTLFMEMEGISPGEWWDYALHSLTDGTEDVRYAASVASGYQRISFPSPYYFASDDAVVTVMSAAPLENSLEESQGTVPQEVTVALIYDRKGTLERVVPIPPKIDPQSIGMYSSGDLLVISKDASRNRLSLLVLDHDGDIKNELSLFDYDYDAKRKVGNKQPLAKDVDAAAIIQIVPDGDNLLLVPQLTQATVIEVNEQGIVRATDLKLPPGYLIRSLFPSDGPYWTVSTFDHVKVLHEKTSKEGYPVFYNGPLFQFNSFDGSLVRRINLPPKLNAKILCVHNGEFTAMTTDKKTGHIELLTGSVPP
ncbi:MAG: hypothetical protein WAM66_03750 [Acidobacteriaceae bacterium]